MSYKEEKLLRRYNKLRNIQSIHTLQLADNRTVKDRGQTNPDREFQNPFFQSKVSSGRSVQLMITSVGVACYSQRGQCVTRLGTFLHTSVELNVSILMLPQRLVESYCFQWVILLVRNPKMGLKSTFFKIVETGSIGDVWYAGPKIELEEESRSGGWCTWSS